MYVADMEAAYEEYDRYVSSVEWHRNSVPGIQGKMTTCMFV